MNQLKFQWTHFVWIWWARCRDNKLPTCYWQPLWWMKLPSRTWNAMFFHEAVLQRWNPKNMKALFIDAAKSPLECMQNGAKSICISVRKVRTSFGKTWLKSIGLHCHWLLKMIRESFRNELRNTSAFLMFSRGSSTTGVCPNTSQRGPKVGPEVRSPWVCSWRMGPRHKTKMKLQF